MIEPGPPGAKDDRSGLVAWHFAGTARLDLATAGLLGLAATAVYLRTLQPDLVGGDGGEFQFVPAILGIPHWTGYPLYVLVGKLWTYLPLGTVAHRMNALSAFFGGGAVACTYMAARRLRAHPAVAAVSVAALGATWLLWQWATMAGVRAAAVFFSALVLWLALRWHDATVDVARSSAAHRNSLIALACGLGFALTHHRSSIFWLPALAASWLVLKHRPRIDARLVTQGAVAFAAPLLLYAYLPWRAAHGAPYDQFHPDTWAGFFELVGAVRVSEGLVGVPPTAAPHRLLLLVSVLFHEFGIATVGWAAVGIVAIARRRLATLALFVVYGGLLVAQTLVWNIGDDRLNDVYLMPLFPLIAVGAAAGLDVAARLARRVAPRPLLWSSALLVGLIGLAGVVPVAAAHRTERRVASGTPPDIYRHDLEWGMYPRRLVTSSLPYVEPNALILADWEQAVLYNYARLAEGIQTGTHVDWGSGTIESIDARSALAQSGRPVYAVRPYDGLKGLHVSATGPLIHISAAPLRSLPAFATASSISLEHGMGVAGYALYDDSGRVTPAPAPLHTQALVVVYWTTMSKPEARYSVSMRLTRPKTGQPPDSVRQQDNGDPVYGLYPTTSWSAGEVVGDAYQLDVRGLATGRYQVAALLYQSVGGGFQNVRVLDANGQPGGDYIPIASLEVAGS